MGGWRQGESSASGSSKRRSMWLSHYSPLSRLVPLASIDRFTGIHVDLSVLLLTQIFSLPTTPTHRIPSYIRFDVIFLHYHQLIRDSSLSRWRPALWTGCKVRNRNIVSPPAQRLLYLRPCRAHTQPPPTQTYLIILITRASRRRWTTYTSYSHASQATPCQHRLTEIIKITTINTRNARNTFANSPTNKMPNPVGQLRQTSESNTRPKFSGNLLSRNVYRIVSAFPSAANRLPQTTS